ncbi:MAG: hypothetical protein ACRDV9_10690 [Acidimicrobiia bacterium]
MEAVTLTALPNGAHRNGRDLRVTIFVTPRLTTGAGLQPLNGGAFPGFEDWPATLAGTTFELAFSGGGDLPAEADPDSPAANSGIWHLLFDACRVGDGAFRDLSKHRFLSFPVKEASAYVLDLYKEVAEGFPTAFPPVTVGPLADLAADIGTLGIEKEEWYRFLDGIIDQENGPKGKRGRFLNRNLMASGGGARRRQIFAEAYRFYDRPGSRDPAGKEAIPPPPSVPPIDFHGFVAFCGDYPNLLRRLGLAIDVLVPRDAVPQPEGQVRVVVPAAPSDFKTWMSAEGTRPWTNYEIVERRFLPRPRDREGDFVDGSLRVENAQRFVVNQIDVDGSTLKTVDFAGNAMRVASHLAKPSMTEDASSLPALRTGGFTLARDARSGRVVGQLDHASDHEEALQNEAPTELFAEDVTRGYRLDVEDTVKPDAWRSLHRRVGEYLVAPPGGEPVHLPIEPDEGYVKGASSSSVPGDTDMYLHEALFGWEGWSLAARRPGQSITQTGTEVYEPDNPTEFPLFTAFQALPGSLPRLRFGRSYRFRTRLVDMAGNSVTDKEVVPSHVTAPHTYRRWDPVPSPAVVPRRPFTEGESLMRMVIRSTLGILPAAYVALPRIVGLSGHVDPILAYLEGNERHLAPPIASQQLAETHGEFDDATRVTADQATLDEQFDIAARESGSFLMPGPTTFVFNPEGPAQATDLSDPARDKGAPLKPGEYAYIDTEDLALPYLPDPFSVGASFTTLPGAAGTELIGWVAGTKWFERSPMRVRIQDGSGPFTWDPGHRLLTVLLPQAEMVTVRLSSFLGPDDLVQMGVWMLEAAGVRAGQLAAAQSGRHWMLTPPAALTLVHAVEKPLDPPVLRVPAAGVPNTGVKRNLGETFAVLSGMVDNHAKSTGRLDIEAAWTEPIDDVLQDAPSTIEGAAHVADFQLQPAENACRIGRDDAPAAGVNPQIHKARHEFRDTKHRYVRYQATATTRFREYFPPEITDDKSLITHVGPELQLDVPSSRRPEPPDLLYVVPTWTWNQVTLRGLSVPLPGRLTPPTTIRTRSGGGLRVYMRRPWYSSGVDELLGVVLENQPWFTVAIDVKAGLAAPRVARAVADDAAADVLARGVVQPGGNANQSPSERLAAGLARRKPSQERAPRPQDVFAGVPNRTKREVNHALRSHLAAELRASSTRTNGQQADVTPGALTFRKAQLDVLEAIALGIFLPSGDPQRYVTHWGRDPIWEAAPVAGGPYIHQFPLRVAVGTDIALLEAPGHNVTVVGHAPKFDTERRLWYCDLQLDAGNSYFPFVKLALARYQPHSIVGQHLSRVVFPDFAQLVAERSLSMTRVGGTAVALSVRGPAGVTRNAINLKFFGTKAEWLELSRFAVAQVERLPPNASTDLAWHPVGDEVRLTVSPISNTADIRYAGTVPLPPTTDESQFRVTVREYEVFETDESEADTHYQREAFFGLEVSKAVRFRLVYAAELVL